MVDIALLQVLGGGAVTVDPAGPAGSAEHAKALWVVFHQQGLCGSVATLLPQVGPHGVAAVVPHHGSWDEVELSSRLPQSPADIHIISSRDLLGTKAADGLQRGFPDGKITPRQVLRFCIREQDMRRRTGSG